MCVRVIYSCFLFLFSFPLKNHMPKYIVKTHHTTAATPSPVSSSTHSPTPYEEEPTKSTLETTNEAQYQNQESLGLSDPSYQNTAAIMSNNKNGDGESSNETIQTKGIKTQELPQAETVDDIAVPVSSLSSTTETHLNNNNSQIENNISKSNNIINENNQTLSNNQNLTIINNDNTDQVYDIPVGE